jgi:hypothetical protein
MLLLYKRSKRHLFAILAGGCGLSFLFSIYCEHRHQEFNFFMLVTRAWELGAGCLLAIWHAHRKQTAPQPKWQSTVLGSAGLLTILGCTVFYSSATRFPGYEAIPPVLGALLLLCAQGGVTNRVLALRPFVVIGLISYSLYLWHWPLLSFAATVDSGETPGRSRAALMLAAAALATLSYRFIEQPFRTARYANRRSVFWVYGSLIVCTLLCGYAFSKTLGFARRAPQLAWFERSLELGRAHPCIGYADKGPILTRDCVPETSSSPLVALLGDSHAEAIESTVKQKAARAGEHMLVMTSYSCPPLRGFTRTAPGLPQYAHACAQFNQSALDIVSRRPDVKVVVLIGSWPMAKETRFVPDNDPLDLHHVSPDQSRANLLKGLEAEVHQLEASGKQVVLLDDWPSINFAPIDHLRYVELPVRHVFADLLTGKPVPDASATSIARADTVVPSAEAVRLSLIAFAQSDPNLHFIDTKQMVCTLSVCNFSDGTNLFYTDGNHVSRFGAERILGNLDFAAIQSQRLIQ